MAAQAVAGPRCDIRRRRRDRDAPGIGQRGEEGALPLRRPPVGPVAGELDGLVVGATPGGILRRDPRLGLFFPDTEVGEGVVGDLVGGEHGVRSFAAGKKRDQL